MWTDKLRIKELIDGYTAANNNMALAVMLSYGGSACVTLNGQLLSQINASIWHLSGRLRALYVLIHEYFIVSFYWLIYI